MSTIHLVGVSGGKDSTALALALNERAPEIDFQYICTPTGDELPEMVAHWEKLEGLLGKPLTRITNRDLKFWMKEKKALPSFKMRWCTQQLKIVPTIAFIKRLQAEGHEVILYVGLRADEETREGIVSSDVQSRFPFREWGWGIDDVYAFLKERQVSIPKRTDCARCPFQRLYEWEDLMLNYPDIYADAERDEELFGHTFRSPGRDSRPAALIELKTSLRERPARRPKPTDDEDEEFGGKCRVCSL